MRWSAAMETGTRSLRLKYATEHDKLPDVLISGAYKQNIADPAAERLGRRDRLALEARIPVRGMNLPNETLTHRGVGGDRKAGRKRIWRRRRSEVRLHTQRQRRRGTPGTTVVVVPLKGGAAVPYPFNPAVLA